MSLCVTEGHSVTLLSVTRCYRNVIQCQSCQCYYITFCFTEGSCLFPIVVQCHSLSINVSSTSAAYHMFRCSLSYVPEPSEGLQGVHSGCRYLKEVRSALLFAAVWPRVQV